MYRQVLDCLESRNIRAFFYIGGNDSMDTVVKLDRYFKEKGKDIRVIGIPKTIDNDLCYTDHTPGFGSAAKYVATTLQEIARDSTAYSVRSVTIVEIMGRNAGWLTASTCLLHQNGEDAPHLIYLPEAEFTVDKFLNDIREKHKTYRSVIVAISEGIELPEEAVGGNFRSGMKDTFGHRYLSGIGKCLENIVSKEIGCKVRSIELNVMQRCASHIASLTDLNEAAGIGGAGVKAALNGESGKMMCFTRVSDAPYTIDYTTVDAGEVANHEKKFPLEWINEDQNGVLPPAIVYFRPLIVGESYPKMQDGMPQHIKLL
jgi:6-phosphofructokinase 1